MNEDRIEKKTALLKIQTPIVGKVYQIVHSRKGAFEGECIKVDAEWADFRITVGTTEALLSDNVKEEGEVVSCRLSHIQSLRAVEDIRIFNQLEKNLTIEEKLERMPKDERSLLLYFGERAVNNRGKVDLTKMNYDDMTIAKRWDIEGLVEFKPISPKAKIKNQLAGIDLHRMLLTENVNKESYYVVLSKEAWQVECAERQARSNRMFFKTVEKEQNDGPAKERREASF